MINKLPQNKGFYEELWLSAEKKFWGYYTGLVFYPPLAVNIYVLHVPG